MAANLDVQRQISPNVEPISALGLRLREIRKRLQAAAERNETVLFSEVELDAELGLIRERSGVL